MPNLTFHPGHGSQRTMANVSSRSPPLGPAKGMGKGRTAYASGTQAPRPGCASRDRGAGAHQPLSRSCPRGLNSCVKRGRVRRRGGEKGEEEKTSGRKDGRKEGREGRREGSPGLNEEEMDFCSSPLVN